MRCRKEEEKRGVERDCEGMGEGEEQFEVPARLEERGTAADATSSTATTALEARTLTSLHLLQ
jgi:hypothetical protein